MLNPEPNHYTIEHGLPFAASSSEPPQHAQSPSRKLQLPPLHWHGGTDPNEDRLWLIENLIPKEGKGLLSGQFGTGKTFAVLDLSASVMTGEPFASFPVERRGGVLFIAPEGATEIPVRLRGVVERKVRPLALTRCVSDLPMDPERLPFAWIGECPPLVDKDTPSALTDVAKAAALKMEAEFGVPLALIVIDTIAASSGVMDENAAAENQRVMSALESLSHQTGAFVLGVDHFGKSVDTGTRGSSAKEAAADVVIAMLGDRDPSGNISNTRMAVRKLRGGATGTEIPYSLEVVDLGCNRRGKQITTCVMSWHLTGEPLASDTSKSERWPASLRVFRTTLTVALTDHGQLMRPYGAEGPEIKAVAETMVRAEFMASYPAVSNTEDQRSDAKRKAFGRALKVALEKGLVASRERGGIDFLWLTNEDHGPDIHGTDRTLS